jgi:hypothetical protein
MKISEFRKLIREEVRKVVNEAKLDPNATYKIDVGVSRGEFDPSDLKKVSGEPLMVAKAVKKRAIADMDGSAFDEEFVSGYKLDNDTYYILTGEESVTVVGKPKSRKYGAFWSLIGTDDEAAADMLDLMDEKSVDSPTI